MAHDGARALLEAVRREYADDPPPVREGFPLGWRQVIEWPDAKITFRLGSVECVLKHKGIAEVHLSKNVRPAAFQYVAIFLEETFSCLFISGVYIIVPADAVFPDDPEAKKLLEATRQFMGTVNFRKDCQAQGFPAVEEAVPDEELERIEKALTEIDCRSPFVQSQHPRLAPHTGPPSSKKRREERVNYTVNGVKIPAELWCVTTRRFHQEKRGADSTKCAFYGYETVADASATTFAQIDPDDDLIISSNKGAWLSKIAGNGFPVVLYIHGYANTLASAVDTAGNLWTELNKHHNGPVNVILFSWPSAGSMFQYDEDLGRIQGNVNVDIFHGLLSDIYNMGDLRDRTTIFGHSMGNVLLMSSVAALAKASLFAQSNFKNILSIAPAVPVDQWKDFASTYHTLTARRVVLCCTSVDKALAAMKFHQGVPAAGIIYNGVPVCSAFHHTVEVPPSIAKTDDWLKGHSYFHTRQMAKLIVAATTSDRTWTPSLPVGMCDVRSAGGCTWSVLLERQPEDPLA